jgi:RimJ/RimL family protein N-acetyltransferase
MPTALNRDIRLVAVSREHAAAMLRWVSDPLVGENIGLRSAPTLEKTLEWIDSAQKNSTVRAFAVLHSGNHIGNVVLDNIDSHLSSARFSIYIGEAQARGAGAGVTATMLALEEGFIKLGLNKIWLTVHAQNHSAIKTYLKVGFILEGVHRDEFLLRGRRIPALYMGMLVDEFKKIETPR